MRGGEEQQQEEEEEEEEWPLTISITRERRKEGKMLPV